ncbi:hypothetical protein [Halorientalis regularis]|uniref:Uncharacterized protein n=1 Tax=Halorientalis regularis TaxID=660518 RepID=A0A1G7J5D4_9EURY|nr:hypothetical protein [Halorientalis regularis]SDF20096.1 hypothetical protein SAMN05216218_104209 [Halorientalis regularis]
MSTLESTDPTTDEWVDIRMTDLEEGEWELDAVVVDGRMEHVDLRVREDLVASFVECLADDLSRNQRAALLDRLSEAGADGPDAAAAPDTADATED